MNTKIFPKPRKGRIAFWQYDLYPFLLSGTITLAKPGVGINIGRWVVETEEYGIGHFKVVQFTMSPKAGKGLQEMLEIARIDRVSAQRHLNECFESRLDRLLNKVQDANGIIVRRFQ